MNIYSFKQTQQGRPIWQIRIFKITFRLIPENILISQSDLATVKGIPVDRLQVVLLPDPASF